MRPVMLALAVTALAAAPSLAQTGACCGAPAPTVAYSPVVTPTPSVAYAPVTPAPVAPVVQTTTVSSGWYPGKYLTDFTRSLFGGGRSTTTTYTAGYAPYTAGYAPAYQPATNVLYRPTYPASYGPVVQSVSRPVVLSPVVSAPVCNACDPCSGVSQAAYQTPGVSDCASCASGGSVYSAGPSYSSGPLTPTPAGPNGSTPQPMLGPSENPDQDRSDLFKPSPADSIDDLLDPPVDEAAASGDYWGAPPLFQGPANSNRVTSRHPAPVHQAVYREPTSAAWTSAKAPAEAPRVIRLDAAGWRAGSN